MDNNNPTNQNHQHSPMSQQNTNQPVQPPNNQIYQPLGQFSNNFIQTPTTNSEVKVPINLSNLLLSYAMQSQNNGMNNRMMNNLGNGQYFNGLQSFIPQLQSLHSGSYLSSQQVAPQSFLAKPSIKEPISTLNGKHSSGTASEKKIKPNSEKKKPLKKEGSIDGKTKSQKKKNTQGKPTNEVSEQAKVKTPSTPSPTSSINKDGKAIELKNSVPNEEKDKTALKKTTSEELKHQKALRQQKLKFLEFEKKLDALIDSKGGIKKSDSAVIFVKLLNEEKSLEAKKKLLNALNSTTRVACKKKVVESGGLVPLKMWLEDARVKNKINMIKFILRILNKYPVTCDSLVRSNIGKVVKKIKKHFEKSEDKQLHEDIEVVVEKWTEIARNKSLSKSQREKLKESSSNTKSDKSESFSPRGGIFSLISGSKKQSSKKPSALATYREKMLQSKQMTHKERPSTQKEGANDVMKEEQKDKKEKPSLKRRKSILKHSVLGKRKNESNSSEEQSSPKRTKPSRKSISWKPAAELVEIKEYEIDRSEEGAIQEKGQGEKKSIDMMRKMEMKDEQLRMKKVKEEKYEMIHRMRPDIPQWIPPVMLDIQPPSAVPKALFHYKGSNSSECKIQHQRVLANPPVVYLSKDLIPMNPSEPLIENSTSVYSAIPNNEPTPIEKPIGEDILDLVDNGDFLSSLLGNIDKVSESQKQNSSDSYRSNTSPYSQQNNSNYNQNSYNTYSNTHNESKYGGYNNRSTTYNTPYNVNNNW